MAHRDLWRDVNKNSLEFMVRDLDLALTMVKIASQADEGSDKRARNIHSARRAYETVDHLREKVAASRQEWRPIQEKLQRLRAQLRELGEVL
jgi:hypothetical protein